MINKGHLLLKIRHDNIKISIEELDEIINIYNHLIDFILIDNTIKEKKFDFIDKEASLHPLNKDNIIDSFYNIFVGVIAFKEYNLLGFFDYLLITKELRERSAIASPDRIYAISKYVDNILYDYEITYKKDFFYNYIYNNEDAVRNYLIEEDSFIYYDTVPDIYSEIMTVYYEIYKNYYLDYERYDDIGIIEYDYFICMTYFYFVKNNLFKNEPEKVLSFLKDFNNDISEKVDIINLTGIKDDKRIYDYKNIISYIDTLYNNSKRMIKVIK